MWKTQFFHFPILNQCGLFYTITTKIGEIHMLGSISEITQLWGRVLKKVEIKLNEKQLFDSFFANSYIYEIRDSVLVIVVNSKVAATLLETRYKSLLQEAVYEVTESNFSFEFVLQSDVSNDSYIPVQQAPKANVYFKDSVINKDLTFDNFVVGDFNREASQAALFVASNPGKMFNPLFIYSHSGLGKTHLLHAIGNYVMNVSKPGSKVLYINSNDFIEEYVKYVKGDRSLESLKDFIVSHDVLLFDDIQTLSDKIKTQEFFFIIFSKMKDLNKHIVITSDKQPTEIKDLEERLITRFSQGLTVEIKEPDQNTCVEILKQKIEARNLNIENFDPSVLYFFSEKFSSNVRELEGALNRLIFYVINMKQTTHITMDVAAEAIQNLIGGKSIATQLNEQKIINTVADYYNLTPTQLTGKVRTGQIVLARHVAIYLIRTMLDVPLKKIGQTFGGKDHTTIASAIEKVDKMLKTDEKLVEALDQIKKKL